MTKDQQIYGVFNYEDDDAPSSSSGRFGSSSFKKSKGKDYTAPVGFVKGGVQGGIKSKAEKTTADSGTKLVSFSERYLSQSLYCIGTAIHYLIKCSEDEETIDDGENEDEQILRSLEGSGKIKGRPSVNAFKRGLTKPSTSSKPSNPQDRYFKEQKGSTGLGDWEKNTKGIGSKLLMKVCLLNGGF